MVSFGSRGYVGAPTLSLAFALPMSSALIDIRPFQRADAPAVRALFRAGMLGLVPTMWRASLLPPRGIGALMALLLALFRHALLYRTTTGADSDDSLLHSRTWLTSCSAEVAMYVALALAAAALLGAQYMLVLRAMQRYVAGALEADCADIEAFYRGGGGDFWCAVMGADIVGIVVAERKSNEELELRRMSVSSRCQGCGVGSRLVRQLEAFGRDAGFKKVVLSCSTPQFGAIALYKANGFATTRVVEIPYRGALANVNILFWEKKLAMKVHSATLKKVD